MAVLQAHIISVQAMALSDAQGCLVSLQRRNAHSKLELANLQTIVGEFCCTRAAGFFWAIPLKEFVPNPQEQHVPWLESNVEDPIGHKKAPTNRQNSQPAEVRGGEHVFDFLCPGYLEIFGECFQVPHVQGISRRFETYGLPSLWFACWSPFTAATEITKRRRQQRQLRQLQTRS